MPKNQKSDFEKVADIVRDAGGRIVGRTRLQKLAYLLELAGVGAGFRFQYRHYGPYSEDLASACQLASLFDVINEEEKATSWGGSYSVFTTKQPVVAQTPEARRLIAQIAIEADPIELELAATAAFLQSEGESKPWLETQRQKPEKAGAGRIDKAKALYLKFREINTPVALPDL